MPIVGMPYKKDELYCPVCGYKYEFVPYTNTSGIPNIRINFILKTMLKLNTRYVNYECQQCKTGLIYDRKKKTIKIKK